MLNLADLQNQEFLCPLSQDVHPVSAGFPAIYLPEAVSERIKAMHPSWAGQDGLICHNCLDKFRAMAMQEVLTGANGTLNVLDKQVLESIRTDNLLTRNLNDEMSDTSSLTYRLADRVAGFVASWWYVASFAMFIIAYVMVNALGEAFDKFPFAFLRLILACVVAIQTSILLISQRHSHRVERQRAENDYRINLKAELEIRDLGARVDQMMLQQWRMLERLETRQKPLDTHLDAPTQPPITQGDKRID